MSLINKERIINDIEAFINCELEKWQKKGKFESTYTYLQRVNAVTRANKIEELTYKKINAIAITIINLSIKEHEYDPDNELYKIEFIGLPPIYINVPVSNNEAHSFDRNIKTINFRNPTYTLTENGFMLLSLDIYNPINHRTYTYNYQNKLIFKKK